MQVSEYQAQCRAIEQQETELATLRRQLEILRDGMESDRRASYDWIDEFDRSTQGIPTMRATVQSLLDGQHILDVGMRRALDDSVEEIERQRRRLAISRNDLEQRWHDNPEEDQS